MRKLTRELANREAKDLSALGPVHGPGEDVVNLNFKWGDI